MNSSSVNSLQFLKLLFRYVFILIQFLSIIFVPLYYLYIFDILCKLGKIKKITRYKNKVMKTLLVSLVAIMCYHLTFSQDTNKKAMEYRRSSLCLIMIDEAKMPKRDTIKEAFLTSPMPEKYNDHNVAVRMFSTDTMRVTPEDTKAFQEAVRAGILGEEMAKKMNAGESTEGDAPAPKKKGGFGKMMGGLGKAVISDATGGLVDTTKKSDFAVLTYKFLQDGNIARQLFDKWFKAENGRDTMSLVFERGLYDASAFEVEKAKNTTRNLALLKDAGIELIQNTFVVVTRYRYLSKEQMCEEIDRAAKMVAEQFGTYATLGAKAGTMALKASMGAGYYVKTTSYLFQLNWNDSISNTFYSQLWNNPEAYAKSDIFGLKYIGEESAWANVKAGIFTKKSESELIRIATINAMDAVLAKLEKKYEVFKTKTPILVQKDGKEMVITAKIGMKEGLEAGDKYEVLEQTEDPETHLTTYKRKGIVKVSKDQIWDNRFGADEERALTGKTQDFQETRFEGKGNYYNNMYIRQIK